MATIFPREERAEALFGEILKNPEACRRLMDTFNDSLDMADVLDAPTVSAQQFAAALFNAYENKDLSALGRFKRQTKYRRIRLLLRFCTDMCFFHAGYGRFPHNR